MLRHFDISRNNFRGPIPTLIGSLENLIVVDLYQNSFSGNIPTELFLLSQLENLMIQANDLTGSIPTEIGNLHNIKWIGMNHNSLQGKIPRELGNLNFLHHVHLHSNQLTGSAPDLSKEDLHDFITDCGSPSFLLQNPIECKSCTMCCNSEGKCKLNIDWNLEIPTIAILVTITLPVIILLVGYIISKRKIQSFRSISTIYQNNSVYCLIFSRNRLGWSITIVTICIQFGILYVFLQASRFGVDNTDWRYSFLCLRNDDECLDRNSIEIYGEILFYVVTISYLGVDFVQSSLQLIMAAQTRDLALMISGLGIFTLTALAMFTTAVYNWALADKNTDLIVNAVILLFVNDLDEKLMEVLEIAVPDWLASRFVEIEANMHQKDLQNVSTGNDESIHTVQEVGPPDIITGSRRISLIRRNLLIENNGGSIIGPRVRRQSTF